MTTGGVEVLINSVNILNEAAKDLPFSTADLSVPVSITAILTKQSSGGDFHCMLYFRQVMNFRWSIVHCT